MQEKKIAAYSQIVGSVLANFRMEKGLGQQDVASGLSISQATWSRIERGDTAISVDQLSEAAKLFNVKPHNILEKADNLAKILSSQGHEVRDYKNDEIKNLGLVAFGTVALIGLASLFLAEE